MRLWSIHPKYLDTKGLLALWREALLAKKVLQNRTRGYKNHPQLVRFKKQPAPVNAINQYLKGIWNESRKRNYKFDATKIGPTRQSGRIPVTNGQIQFEFKHLLRKLEIRDPERYKRLQNNKHIEPHGIFKILQGNMEAWEKTRRQV